MSQNPALSSDEHDLARLKRQQLYNQTIHAAWHDVSISIIKERPRDEILLLVLKHVSQLLNTQNTYIALTNNDTESFIPMAATGIFPDMLRVYQPVKKGHGLAGRVWSNAKSMFVNFGSDENNPYSDSPLFHHGFSGVIAVPVFQNDNVVGILGAGFVERIRDFDDLDLEQLETFAVLVANIFHNADLHDRLNQSQEFAAQILDKMGEGMAATDSHSVITMVNRKLRDMIGIEKSEDAIGWKASVIFPDYFESLAVGYGAFLARENNIGARTWLRRHDDNSLVPVLLSGTPRFNNHELAGSYLVTRDITQLKAAEEEFISYKEKIERAELFNKQFLAVTSHELRNPLNAILGLTQILMSMNLGDEANAMLATIHDAGENMAALVTDILDYSRLESGKLTLNYTSFDISQFMIQIKRSFSNAEKERNSVLTISQNKDVPPMLYGDEGRLRQVIANLITNAFKFTQNGVVSVSVQPEPPEHLKFIIQDSGQGLSETAKNHIFEPFFTESPKSGMGNGLGLTISLHLVELMNGKLWLDETGPQGTRFIFTAKLIPSQP